MVHTYLQSGSISVMSIFLYLSVPPSEAVETRDAFDLSIKIMDVTDTPAGKVVRGRQSWLVIS